MQQAAFAAWNTCSRIRRKQNGPVYHPDMMTWSTLTKLPAVIFLEQKEGVIMGIRLYFRNKYNPKEEYCMGKLLHYVNSVNHIECVDFLIETGALDDYEWVDLSFACKTSGDFLDECVICAYQDYGCMFELSTEDLCLFIYLYRKDQKEFWGPDHIVQYDLDLEDELKFIQKHAAVENRWEFRLGA